MGILKSNLLGRLFEMSRPPIVTAVRRCRTGVYILDIFRPFSAGSLLYWQEK
ncbi:hypothetical protein KSP40_PGU009887 [Platanthera guangdongensis]|uniref:Uncharacterized protein n=1 Tax=Platanthera guangdongensis TaxID=2320717 RepID=A0ABR2M6T3_9ASPA